MKKERYWLHILLFVLTFITTTMSGAELINAYSVFGKEKLWDWMPWNEIRKGFLYSFPFMSFLLCHEFGHYFTSRFHKVRASLPFCIPFYFPFMFHFGSFGAVITMRERPNSAKKYFDIGIAGPIAGIIAGLIVLTYGYLNLPSLTYIFNIHSEYSLPGGFPNDAYYKTLDFPSVKLGDSLIILLFEKFIGHNSNLIPNGYELMHYPFLFAGWLAMFFTALNLFPIGQLDGGHIVYGLFGKRNHALISRAVLIALIIYGGVGIINFKTDGWSFAMNTALYMLYLYLMMRKVFSGAITLRHNQLAIILSSVFILSVQIILSLVFKGIEGYSPYLFFTFFVAMILGVDHPPTEAHDLNHGLSTGRKILGWFSLLIFILCFSPKPFNM